MRQLKITEAQLPYLRRYLRIANTGLLLADSDASHFLTIAPGSNLTAARQLTLTTGDADRTITLSGNPTLADWFDQAVKTSSDPTFNTLKLNDSDDTHQLTLAVTSNLTAARTLSLVPGDADRTVTLTGNPTLADWFDQAVKTTSTPSFAGATFTADVNMGNNNVYFTENDAGNSGTSITINWLNSNKQKVTLTGNCTFTFTAPNGPCNLILQVRQDGTGSRTATWPATVKWPSGSAPTLTTTASRMDLIGFYYDGTNYYGGSSLNFTVS